VASRIARGDVRLYQFAPPDKRRPVVVLTRDSAIAYLSAVTVAPITSTIRGVPSQLVLDEEDGMKAPCAVNLHNAVTISQDRLGRRNEPNLRGTTLLSRLRSQSILGSKPTRRKRKIMTTLDLFVIATLNRPLYPLAET